jgi:hypothetical protein
MFFKKGEGVRRDNTLPGGQVIGRGGGCGGLVLVLAGFVEPPPGQAQGPRILIPTSPCPYTIPSLQKMNRTLSKKEEG